MKRLDPEAFRRACAWVREHARPLDAARLGHAFEGGPADAVLGALAPYQNADGGFGHALEPDFRLPASSVWATVIAFRHLRELGAGDGVPLVARGVRYLVERFEPGVGWRAVPPEVNDHAHAPWWHFDAAAPPPASWGMPSAEAAAVLCEHARLVPAARLDEVRALAAERLAREPAGLREYAAQSYAALAEALGGAAGDDVWRRLLSEADGAVHRTREEWVEREFQPVWLVPAPRSRYHAPLADVIRAHLDFLIETQTPEGCWAPNWSWGGSYEDAWAAARREWSGDLTVQYLLALRAHGRLEPG